MPPETPVRPKTIPGVVLRSYEIATVDDVDRYLVGLKTWLIKAIDQVPQRAMTHISRYNEDLDRLLDERLKLMSSSS